MVQKPQGDAEHKERRIDLSLPQVAGSAVAAVAAAVMASQLGVYGTIAGAGVMSVVATCGGSVFQHFFRRTGEQIREVTVQVKHPGGRQVTVRTRETTPADEAPRAGPTAPDDGATTVLRTTGAGPEHTRLLRFGPEHTRLLDPGPDRTRPLGPAPSGEHVSSDDAHPDDAYSDARTHGTRIRGWRRSALAAVAVFAMSMAGITAYELVSGNGLGGGGGTTVGSVVRGERGSGTTDPAPTHSTDRERTDDQEESGPGSDTGTPPATEPGAGTSATPGPGTGGAPTAEPGPTTTPSGGAASPAPTTTPTAPEESAPAAPDPAGEAPAQQDGATTGADTGP
ncbi:MULTISPECIES: hypothetical protein [Streptomyces]|uniref:hypothetical protein n=1 Tax=Streptomyces TaxID=1883 RepID=UPI0006FCED04|nr:MULTISPECIES: hypothetical protein [unclassified Streptomyces]KQX92665.1 hypothetical protein ASD26_22335 [Streptomyces sp. Root1319]KQZ18459.1 hypothetical protein ASD51_29780 [Streptomyces sp. Root55]